MVRKKEKPNQLTAAQQKVVTWNLDESRACQSVSDENPGSSRSPVTVEDLTIDDSCIESEEDEDANYIPPSYKTQRKNVNIYRKRNKKPKNKFNVSDDEEEEYLPPAAFHKNPVKTTSDETITTNVRKPRKKVEKMDYGLFNEVLKKCEFSVKIDSTLSNMSKTFCLLGEIILHVVDFPLDLPYIDSFWLYISRNLDESAFYFEWYEEKTENNSPNNKSKKLKSNNFKFCYIKGLVNINLWSALNNKRCFQIVVNKSEYTKNMVSLHIYFLKSGFVKLNYPYEYNTGNKLLSSVCTHFFGIQPCEVDGEKNYKHDNEIFYKAIKKIHESSKYMDYDVQHPNLIPQLRPYQKQAVQWMLYQERFKNNLLNNKNIHPLYVKITSLDNKVMYYNKYGKYFIEEEPLEGISCPGGILADEMGLGKTVEVLACLMCHLKKNDDCEKSSKVLKSENLNDDTLQNTYKTDLKDNNEAVDSKHKYNMILNSNFETNDSEEHENFSNIKKESEISDTSENEKIIKSKLSNSRGNRPRRSAAILSSYSQLDSILDSDGSDVDYAPNVNSEGESDEDINPIENNLKKYSTRKSLKRKLSEVNYSENEDQEFMPVSTKIKLSYDPEKEITDSTILVVIDEVILNQCWNGVLKDYKKNGSYKEYRKYLKIKKKDPYYLMTLREKLNIDYLNQLSEYSTSSFITKKGCENFFTNKVQQKSFFECACGMVEKSSDGRQKVQCTICSLWQHAACVQFNLKDPDRGEYICPHCWTTQSPVASGATLIVSPSSISYQWVEEINKHIKKKSLKVFVYSGVANNGYIQPCTLAANDIVITTYETLRREVNYVDLPHCNSEAGRKFRFPKRFMTTPSPLPCVEWWRICLDEAQMVESTSSKTAEMALRLSAINRWCITGTPIQKSVNDLQGLLTFLGVDPFCVPQWWQRCLYDPYCLGNTEPLHNIMAKYMWRNSKVDVVHQLDIPPQTEEVHWLNFSPVEEHFYKRLHADCSSEALKRIRKFPNRSLKLSSLDRKSFSSLIHPLIKLRQACNHPQIVKGHFTSLNRKTLTMEQLLDNLLKKTQLEAEDAQRIIVASLNGLAALDIIQENYINAVEKYREVLRSIENFGAILKTDSLQQLHTLHNLSELIKSKHEGVFPTLRDEKLDEEAKAIKEKYLKHYPQRVAEAEIECAQNTNAVEDLKQKFKYKRGWWLLALESLDQNFVAEVRESLLSHYSRFEERKCILYPIKYKQQLMQLLETKLKMLGNQRKSMITNVRNLLEVDATKLLNGAIDCHLRPTENENDSCILCAVHELFEDYEQNLFFMQEKNHNRSTDRSKETKDMKEKLQLLEEKRQGNWGQSEIEKILKYIQTKSLKIDSEVHEDSQTHLGVLQIMKKEFKNFRILWRAIFDQVSALDEVNMATLRFRLRYPGEELPAIKKKKNDPSEDLEKKVEAPKYILEEAEVVQQEIKLKSEKIVSENDLRVKLGQYYYLQNLKKGEFGKEGDSNPEPCPVCQGKLGHRWKVLLCGHSYCMDCVSILIKRVQFRPNVSLICPMCRQPTKIREIAYVDMKVKEQDETIKVTGSLSTKIEGVVRVMLKIKTSDPEAKVLIFSYWKEVLSVVADGLEQNGITYRMLLSNNKFQMNLDDYKSKQEITTLLLLISSGANGLNLVEATHIILVEPILNPAAEFQAIGRIHRIGQTKSTVVHRFLIHSTIEERMHTVLHPKYEDSSKEKDSLTIEDLYQLFITQKENDDYAEFDHEDEDEDFLQN